MRGSRRIAAVGVLALTWVLLGVALGSSQAASRADLEQRFANRADLSSRFASSYVADLVARERAVATKRLSGNHIAAADFARVVEDLGFTAAVLLDDRGTLLAVVPSNTSILGSAIAPKYAHLRAAEAGRVGVSEVVPGAATGQPVVAFATPFQTTSGSRVFSGAFDLGQGPLGDYLRNSLPYRGATSDLVDRVGKVIASSGGLRPSHRLADTDPALAGAIGSRDSAASFSDGATKRRFVTAGPAGTPWTLVNTVPEDALYSPLGGLTQMLPWVVLAGLGIAGVFILILFLRLADSRAQLAHASVTDPLTGLANRRAWDTALGNELARSRRYGTPVAVAILDLDNFKQFNDNNGHQAGDQLLVAAALSWGAELREVDTLARYGGEEFGVLLPGTSGAAVASTLDRIRAATPGACTASAGGAEWDGSETALELVARADTALYAAKAAGRAQTIVATTFASLPMGPGQASRRPGVWDGEIAPVVGLRI